jgi:hypothetical protein
LKINLRVEFEGIKEPKEITCSASDLVAFESKFSTSISNFGDDPKLTYLLFLAWHSEFRRKATALEFDPWVETVANIGASDLDPKSVA